MDLPCDRKRRAEGKEGRGGSAGGRDGRANEQRTKKTRAAATPSGTVREPAACASSSPTGGRRRRGEEKGGGGEASRGGGGHAASRCPRRAGGGGTEMTADARRVRARARDPRSGIGRARARRVGPSSAVLFLRLVQTLRVGVPGSQSRRNPAARGNARAVGRATYVIDVRDDGHVADVVLLVHLATELIDGELRREGGVERGGGGELLGLVRRAQPADEASIDAGERVGLAARAPESRPPRAARAGPRAHTFTIVARVQLSTAVVHRCATKERESARSRARLYSIGGRSRRHRQRGRRVGRFRGLLNPRFPAPSAREIFHSLHLVIPRVRESG